MRTDNESFLLSSSDGEKHLGGERLNIAYSTVAMATNLVATWYFLRGGVPSWFPYQ